MNEQTSLIVTLGGNPGVREEIRDYLAGRGFELGTAADTESLRRLLRRRRPDIVILDTSLPGNNIFDLTGDLRQWPDIGVIVISNSDDLIDKVAALESGADDYLARPFHMRELLARIRSIMRRCGREIALRRVNGNGSHEYDHPHIAHGRLRFDGWVMDLDARRLISPDGEEVELPAGEFDLLLALAEHPGRALTRDELAELLKGPESGPVDRGIDVQIGRLRRRLEKEPRRPALIKTIRGIGYMFAAEVSEG